MVLVSFTINLSCDNLDSDKSRFKTNSSPAITSVKILPENPNLESELNVFTQSQNPSGESVTYRYQWMKNDEEIIGEDKNTLNRGNFRKGDLIRVKVTPSDGKGDGKPFLSDPVKILNSPPVIQEVWIEPKVPYVTDGLRANVKSSDPDGNSIYYSYQWQKNGIVLDGETGEILKLGQFKKGDSIAVIVTPNDGESRGMPKKSVPTMISNSAPLIVSSPPNKMVGNIYTYEVRANDPDNDPITFTLMSAPKGMEINKEAGLIRWEIQKDDKGKHTVEVEVSDDSGAKSRQRYMLEVDVR